MQYVFPVLISTLSVAVRRVWLSLPSLPFLRLHPERSHGGHTASRIIFALGAMAFTLVLVNASAFAAAADGTATVDASFHDPLATPASLSPLAVHSFLVGVAHSGKGLVAVGRRGLILMSSDLGKTWEQIPSPVSADLTAIRFSDAKHGWIVGHDAVVLKTTDGGQTWKRKLDGRAILNIILKTYEARGKAGDVKASGVVDDAKRSVAQSATPGVMPFPLLDVWFSNSNNGFVVGAFGLIFHTADGGNTWTPWIDRTENDRMNHIYAINGVGGAVYIAGEQGFLRRLDTEGDRFVKITSPYEGSYFGLYVKKDLVTAYGLRGNAYLSKDGGAQWNKVETGLPDNIIATLPGAGEDLLFVSQAGDVLSTDSNGGDVKKLKVLRGTEIYAAVTNGPGAIVTTGLDGVSVVGLSAPLK